MQNLKQLGNTFVILIVLTTLSIINTAIFKVYQSTALYVNILFSILGLLFFHVELSKSSVLYLSLVAACVLLSLFITDGGIGSVLTFLAPLLLLLVYSQLFFTKYARKILLNLGIIGLVILFLYSFKYNANYKTYLKVKINPNTLGIFTMFFFMIVCVLGQFKRKLSYLGVLILLFFSIYSMYNYESRGTTVALCCFVLMSLVPKKMYNRRVFFILTALLIVVGTAFPFVYLALYKSGYTVKIFGKPLFTGREKLWSNMFALMSDDFVKILFGMGSNTVLWEHELNVHNNFFNIIVNFGVVGYLLYYTFILNQIWNASKYISQPVIRKSLSMFLCSVIVLGFSETTSLWAVIFPFAYFGLILANSEASFIERKNEIDNINVNILVNNAKTRYAK